MNLTAASPQMRSVGRVQSAVRPRHETSVADWLTSVTLALCLPSTSACLQRVEGRAGKKSEKGTGEAEGQAQRQGFVFSLRTADVTLSYGRVCHQRPKRKGD